MPFQAASTVPVDSLTPSDSDAGWNRTARQWAETLVEVRGNLADIRETTI